MDALGKNYINLKLNVHTLFEHYEDDSCNLNKVYIQFKITSLR